MAGLKHFEIRLEGNPANVYFAGDAVKGKISFGLVGDGKNARGQLQFLIFLYINLQYVGVCVEFKGQALVEFEKYHRTHKTGRYYDYVDEETYFKEQTYVIGGRHESIFYFLNVCFRWLH